MLFDFFRPNGECLVGSITADSHEAALAQVLSGYRTYDSASGGVGKTKLNISIEEGDVVIVARLGGTRWLKAFRIVAPPQPLLTFEAL